MPTWIIAFFCGSASILLLCQLPSLWLLLIVPIIAAVYCLIPGKLRRYWRFLLAGSMGFGWALLYAFGLLNWSLPNEFEGKNLVLTGYVASLVESKSNFANFEFATDSIANTTVHTKLKLSWYGEHPRLLAGDKWQLTVRLKRPHGTLNPGGFDFEKYLFEHHIRATGYVVPDEATKFLGSYWYRYPLAYWRQSVLQKINDKLLSDVLTPIIVALITGSETAITPAQWQTMRNTGTSYLVAISGLHVGLVASLVFLLVQFCWRRQPKLPLLLPAPIAGAIAGLIVALCYSAVAGFSVPTQRALIMLLVFSGNIILRRNLKPGVAFLWALLLVLLIDPLATLTLGFWLSFGAVAGIIYVTAWRIGAAASPLKRTIHMQVAVSIILLPLTLLFFQQVSLTVIIANLLAMPGVCLIVVPLCLLGALLLLLPGNIGGWLLWLSVKLLHLIWWWLSWLAEWSHCNWYHSIYNYWILLAAIIGVMLLLAPRGFPGKVIGLIWLLPLFCYEPAAPAWQNAWVTILDVGQGLACVIRTQKHTLIYDTGPKSLISDAGETIVVPFLRTQGVNAIDTMVVSHGDADHIGGAASILQAIPTQKILTSVPEMFISNASEHCYAGQSWDWDGVKFQMLAPFYGTNFTGNDASCVLKITAGKQNILFTGDIEKNSEGLLLQRESAELSNNILIAPHHGSATSSSPQFIAAVHPAFVVFPIGYENRFHFPAKSVIKRYQGLNAQLFDTASQGAITFKLDGAAENITFSSYRKAAKRFWHD